MITAQDILLLQKGMGHWVSVDTERLCQDCDQTKPLSAFYIKTSGKWRGYSVRCKSCERLAAERRLRK